MGGVFEGPFAGPRANRAGDAAAEFGPFFTFMYLEARKVIVFPNKKCPSCTFLGGRLLRSDGSQVLWSEAVYDLGRSQRVGELELVRTRNANSALWSRALGQEFAS